MANSTFFRNSGAKPDAQLDNSNPCGFCGTKESLKLYPTCSIEGDKFHINRCFSCHALFLSPRPTPEQLEKAYDDSYYGQGQAKFTPCIEKVLDYFRSARSRTVKRYIKPPAKILDIGCGNGGFLDCLIKSGFEGYGVELPGKAAQRAAQVPSIKLKVGRSEEADFAEDFFDGICLWHVFEHLTEPKKTLQIIKRTLKPNGFFFLSIPNIGSFQSRLFRGNWFHMDPPKHLFFLTAANLISQMEERGFKLIKQNYFSLEQNPFGIQQSILNCLLNKREVLFEALKGNDDHIREYSKCAIKLQKLFCLTSLPLSIFLAYLESALRKGGTMELIFRKTG